MDVAVGTDIWVAVGSTGMGDAVAVGVGGNRVGVGDAGTGVGEKGVYVGVLIVGVLVGVLIKVGVIEGGIFVAVSGMEPNSYAPISYPAPCGLLLPTMSSVTLEFMPLSIQGELACKR